MASYFMLYSHDCTPAGRDMLAASSGPHPGLHDDSKSEKIPAGSARDLVPEGLAS
jgi:hypothetical protein